MDIKEKIEEILASNNTTRKQKAEAISTLFEEHAQQRERDAFEAARCIEGADSKEVQLTPDTNPLILFSAKPTYPTYNDYVAAKGMEVKDGWIKVDDKLPPERLDVFVCRQRQLMAYSHYRVGEDWYGYGQPVKTYGITHWKELTPPKP